MLPGGSRWLHWRRARVFQRDGSALPDALGRQMRPPSFPITLEMMPSGKSFYEVGDGSTVEVGSMQVRCRRLMHPQGSLGYRIDAGGRSVCFATETSST